MGANVVAGNGLPVRNEENGLRKKETDLEVTIEVRNADFHDGHDVS